jgi:hypothetical protein
MQENGGRSNVEINEVEPSDDFAMDERASSRPGLLHQVSFSGASQLPVVLPDYA